MCFNAPRHANSSCLCLFPHPSHTCTHTPSRTHRLNPRRQKKATHQQQTHDNLYTSFNELMQSISLCLCLLTPNELPLSLHKCSIVLQAPTVRYWFVRPATNLWAVVTRMLSWPFVRGADTYPSHTQGLRWWRWTATWSAINGVLSLHTFLNFSVLKQANSSWLSLLPCAHTSKCPLLTVNREFRHTPGRPSVDVRACRDSSRRVREFSPSVRVPHGRHARAPARYVASQAEDGTLIN